MSNPTCRGGDEDVGARGDDRARGLLRKQDTDTRHGLRNKTGCWSGVSGDCGRDASICIFTSGVRSAIDDRRMRLWVSLTILISLMVGSGVAAAQTTYFY